MYFFALHLHYTCTNMLIINNFKERIFAYFVHFAHFKSVFFECLKWCDCGAFGAKNVVCIIFAVVL